MEDRPRFTELTYFRRGYREEGEAWPDSKLIKIHEANVPIVGSKTFSTYEKGNRAFQDVPSRWREDSKRSRPVNGLWAGWDAGIPFP